MLSVNPVICKADRSHSLRVEKVGVSTMADPKQHLRAFKVSDMNSVLGEDDEHLPHRLVDRLLNAVLEKRLLDLAQRSRRRRAFTVAPVHEDD